MFRVIFFSILALDGLFWWWADRRARRLPRPSAWRAGVAIFVGLQLGVLGAMVLVPGLRHAAHHYVPSWVLGLMYLWHLLILPAWAIIAGAWSVAHLAAAGARRVAGRKAASRVEPAGMDESPAWSRRQVLAAAALSAPP